MIIKDTGLCSTRLLEGFRFGGFSEQILKTEADMLDLAIEIVYATGATMLYALLNGTEQFVYYKELLESRGFNFSEVASNEFHPDQGIVICYKYVSDMNVKLADKVRSDLFKYKLITFNSRKISTGSIYLSSLIEREGFKEYKFRSLKQANKTALIDVTKEVQKLPKKVLKGRSDEKLIVEETPIVRRFTTIGSKPLKED